MAFGVHQQRLWKSTNSDCIIAVVSIWLCMWLVEVGPTKNSTWTVLHRQCIIVGIVIWVLTEASYLKTNRCSYFLVNLHTHFLLHCMTNGNPSPATPGLPKLGFWCLSLKCLAIPYSHKANMFYSCSLISDVRSPAKLGCDQQFENRMDNIDSTSCCTINNGLVCYY